MASHVRRLVPGDVPSSEVTDMWLAFDAIERHAAAAKTLLAARVEDARVWARAGDQSAAHHLARTSGTTIGQAQAGLETAKRLRQLPATEAALRRGDLSQAQAHAIASAAAVNPAAERPLLETARHATLTQLREEANRAKAAGDPDPDATHRHLHQARRLRRFTDGEGAWNVQARGTADAGAAFNAALDPIIDEIFRTARRAGRLEGREAYAFDALIELARRARSGAAPEPAGVSGGSAEVLVPARPGRTNPSYLALLRVDVAALARGRVDGDELCEIAGVGAVPARVARDLLGDAVVKLVITRGVDVVNVTHLGRSPTAAQRIARLWTCPGCTNTACMHTVGIQYDHRRPWADVHETVSTTSIGCARRVTAARPTWAGPSSPAQVGGHWCPPTMPGIPVAGPRNARRRSPAPGEECWTMRRNCA
jgi:hypothetical protein